MGVVKNPFSVRIEPDLLNPLRFRWVVCEGEQIVMRSPRAYSNREEAENEANEMMGRLKTQRGIL
jgi:hypothetical protein